MKITKKYRINPYKIIRIRYQSVIPPRSKEKCSQLIAAKIATKIGFISDQRRNQKTGFPTSASKRRRSLERILEWEEEKEKWLPVVGCFRASSAKIRCGKRKDSEARNERKAFCILDRTMAWKCIISLITFKYRKNKKFSSTYPMKNPFSPEATINQSLSSAIHCVASTKLFTSIHNALHNNTCL